VKQHWVFAYGSNMHLADLRRWFGEKRGHAPAILQVEQAFLEDFKLVWNYDSPTRVAGAANVEPASGHRLPGLLLLVDEPTLDGLDQKEGHPERYFRGHAPRPVRRVEGGHRWAWIYVVTPAYQAPRGTWPSPHYRGLLIEAAREFKLPHWHRRHLDRIETSPGEASHEDKEEP
jgi:gamma-glutamylcyclotransferase (GGCT)/AIG2-like uncharacterized protein YtfP